MTEKRFTKGEWTNCRYDICEILENGEYFCTVATKDVDLIIKVLEENELLKQELFEARKDYLIETADISDKPYLDDEIEKERKRIFGDVE